MSPRFRSKSVRDTLARKDFLTSVYDPKVAEAIRNTHLVVLVTGTKRSGKTTITDKLFGRLSALQYRVITTRASEHAEEVHSDYRRDMVKKQERDKKQWLPAINALRTEGADALKRGVQPFLDRNTRDDKEGIVLATRYPLVDTLVKQHRMGAPLEEVAQHLRGFGEDPSGYVRPDIVLIFTCKAGEAKQRALIKKPEETDTRTSAEASTKLGPEFERKIAQEARLYRRFSGYKTDTGTYDGNRRIFPGIAHYFDTSIPGFDYQRTYTEVTGDLERAEEELTDRILADIIIPAIDEKDIEPNGNARAASG